MASLATTYLGLNLKNPILVGSSGLTASVSGVKQLEAKGAGAVVLKSIFEEEIAFELDQIVGKAKRAAYNLEQFDYLDYQLREEKLKRYTQLVEGCKKEVSIPVIASVNCVYSHEWSAFAKHLQDAGADALELNMFFLPSDFKRSAREREKAYFNVIERVKREVSIPIALKISYYFSDLAQMIQRLSDTGVAGLVLFNRFYSPDIDIEKLSLSTESVFSSPAELYLSLKWIAMMSGRVRCDLAASTGVHDGKAVIKQLLAGARAVQVVSALYRRRKGYLETMLAEIEDWMKRHRFKTIGQFRGRLAQEKSANPAAYERMQFMRYGARR
ncbi:MAG: dihydroorotate dehydrogenase-like protein [bacterium]